MCNYLKRLDLDLYRRMALTTIIAHNLIQENMPENIGSIVKFYVYVCDRVYAYKNLRIHVYELI